MAGLMIWGEWSWMGRMGRGDTTFFPFVTDVRKYLHRWSWSYGFKGLGLGMGSSFLFIYIPPSPLLCWLPRCKFGLEWIGLDSLKTMDTPFLLSVSPSSSSRVCLFLSSSSRSVIETDERRRRLSSCLHSCPAERRHALLAISKFIKLLTGPLKTPILIAYTNIIMIVGR